MTDRAALPGLPAEMAVRWVALGLLDEAGAAHAGLGDPSKPEALHDFRVALRRLRSTLRAYGDLLGGSVGGKDRRRLRDLARATGHARDAEVQTAWLINRLRKARGAERGGIQQALERSNARAADAAVHLTGAADAFPAERERLEKRIRPYRLELRTGEVPGGVTFSRALGARLRTEADALEEELAGVLDETCQDEAHRARIIGKRIRYLLEPVRDIVPGARELLKELKGLQELLGDMHDAHVMMSDVALSVTDEEEDRGTRALHQRLAEERTEYFSTLRDRWLHGGAAAFVARVRALADTLEGAGPDREIERK